jgi:hypothetical protein
MPYWLSVKLCPSILEDMLAIGCPLLSLTAGVKTPEIIIIKYFFIRLWCILITVLSVRVHFASYLFIVDIFLLGLSDPEMETVCYSKTSVTTYLSSQLYSCSTIPTYIVFAALVLKKEIFIDILHCLLFCGDWRLWTLDCPLKSELLHGHFSDMHIKIFEKVVFNFYTRVRLRVNGSVLLLTQ